MNVFSEFKGISSAKGAVKKALNYVKSAAKIPAYLSSDVTEQIVELASELGYNSKQFEKPLFKAIRILNLPEDLAEQYVKEQIAKEVVRHTNALTSDQTELIAAVEQAGVDRFESYKEQLAILQADFKVMLRAQGWTKKQLLAKVKSAGIVLPEFEAAQA